MIKKLPCKCNCVFEGVGESCSQITVMTSAFINTYFTMHFIRHIINTRLVEYVPTAYTLLNSWALCPRLIRIWKLNMIHYGNSFKIRLKVKFWYIKNGIIRQSKNAIQDKMTLLLFFTTFNYRTGKIELFALLAEDEIKTVSFSSFKRSRVNQKRC